MKELIFGADLIKILEKNGYNEIGNTVTKYKDGTKSIFCMYSIISNINKLETNTPFIQFDYDEETNGLIDIVCFPNGEEGDGIECKSDEDILWFIKNANWKNSNLTESSEQLIDNKKAVNEISKYCNDLDVAMTIAGNIVTVYKDVWNNEYKNIEFKSVKQVIKEIDEYIKSNLKEKKDLKMDVWEWEKF